MSNKCPNCGAIVPPPRLFCRPSCKRDYARRGQRSLFVSELDREREQPSAAEVRHAQQQRERIAIAGAWSSHAVRAAGAKRHA